MSNPITRIILTAVDLTKAGIASARAGLDSIGTSAGNLKSLLGSVFTGLSVVGFIGQMKSVANEMDNAVKSAAAAGTSVEKFSGLSYASSQSGGGPDVLQKSLIKLSGSLEESNDTASKAADTWRKMNLDPKQFDDSADALLAIADRFKAMPDGIAKTNLAVDLFGEKIGPKMIALLNEGSEGVRRLTDEGRQLGKVLDDETGAAAVRFNDTLDRLNARKVSLFSKALPSLEQYVSALDEIIGKGTALDKIKFFTTGYIGEDVLNRISDAGQRVKDYTAEIDKLQGQLQELKRVEGNDSPNVKIWEQRIDALEKTRGTLIAAEKESNADRKKSSDETTNSIVGNYEEEAKAFKKSTGEKISDAERLKDALNSAFSQALGEEEQYLREAKNLRAKASGPSGDQSEVSTRDDATIAALKLQRLEDSGTPEEIRNQAEAVRELASRLEDQQYSAWLVVEATLAEAKAAEISAAAARERAAGLAEQMQANDARLAGFGKVLEEISKPAALDIVSTAQTEASLSKLREAKELIEFINSTPLKLGTAAGALAGALRNEALQFGGRG
ncbi:MAG: hypothetical protein QG662_1943 [Pseudomonadota bacterium]|nr:hypothetical protein [Pseudomonadota bacterium]